MDHRPGYFRRRINSFRFALKGVWTFFRDEEHARIHLLAALAAVILGFVLGISALEWVAIVVAIGLVFVSELLNTAIEGLTDLAQPEKDPRAGRVKDIAAGAVLLASLVAVIIGVIVFLPRLV